MKVLVILQLFDEDDALLESRNVRVVSDEAMTVRDALQKALRQAEWDEDDFKIVSRRLVDVDFNLSIDANEDAPLEALDRYEVKLMREVKSSPPPPSMPDPVFPKTPQTPRHFITLPSGIITTRKRKLFDRSPPRAI